MMIMENQSLLYLQKIQSKKNIPLIVESGDTIQVICCQVTHNLINSQCITSEDVIHELGNSYDLLTKKDTR